MEEALDLSFDRLLMMMMMMIMMMTNYFWPKHVALFLLSIMFVLIATVIRMSRNVV